MPDFSTMTPTEFSAWQAEQNNPPVSTPAHVTDPPSPAPAQDRYAPTAWGSAEFDFTAPSGQTCRMRKVPIEDLIANGMMEKLNTLSPHVDKLIAKADNQPPTKSPDVDTKSMVALIEVLNELIPLVVLEPQVYPTPAAGEERVEGRVYVNMIDLADRLAIMNRTLGSLEKLANFRE